MLNNSSNNTLSVAWLDWVVIFSYLVALLLFIVYLGRKQETNEDYYVAGRKLGAWPAAISVMATQCSTNSILGAPAFVAFTVGGGLNWLQYEFALPLAMIFLMLFVMPVFRQLQLISIYTFLEQRFDRNTRVTLSLLFLFVRAFATAVTVYGIALVVDLLTGVGFFGAVVLLAVITVVYDTIGGIKGVIYSDIIQMAILVTILIMLLALLIHDAGGLFPMLDSLGTERRAVINLSANGITDGETFAFWPMLFGGFFLYLAYYGCDQSQVQRELCTKDINATNLTLVINGFFRFPLVLLYCFVGVGIAWLASNSNEFTSLLFVNGSSSPNYNLAVPIYMITTLPVGLVGLALVALFAAAMSSLDSVLNSMSATTMEDFVRPALKQKISLSQELWLARATTVFWGIVTIALAFLVDDIAPTVLEAINKIGSLANGPVLAVFLIGLFTQGVRGRAALLGLACGITLNGLLWLYAPSVSWLWWNVFGFVTAVLIAVTCTHLQREKIIWHKPVTHWEKNWLYWSFALVIWFGLLIVIGVLISR